MQTFLPHPDLVLSARCLDTKRLGKQRVETKQILIALGVDVGDHEGNLMSRWRNHPAVTMWRGFELWLAMYGVAVCNEWRLRGYRDTLRDQFIEAHKTLYAEVPWAFHDNAAHPRWWGDPAFHASHRSNLLRKDPVHYSQFGWSEPHDLPYVWPTNESGVPA
jgi:hypothetical protein